MRNPRNNSKATVILRDKSSSADNDTIGNRIWYCCYDTNNDGIFDENEKEVINDENNTEYVFETDKVGNILIVLEVKETFDNTIPKLLTDEDYLNDITLNEENKGFEVGNVAPEAKVEITKSKALDIAVTFGDTHREDKELYNTKFVRLNNSLKEKGINANIYALKTSSITAQDTFAWKEYSHPITDGQRTPVIFDGNDIKMIGYHSRAFKDFLYVADEDNSQKIFTFDLQYGSNDWHSMEGGGFLFNTKVSDDENIIDGYCLLVTRQGLSLISINNSALDKFRNGQYANVQRFGKLIQTFKLPVELRENHSFKITVESDSISVWDNDIPVIEEYSIEDKGHHGYGPIISHLYHNCGQRSFFTFKNIRMETVSDKSLLEGLKETEWRNGAEKILVNISDTPIGDLSTSEQALSIAQTMLEANMSFIGVGETDAIKQYNDFICLGGLEGYTAESYEVDLFFAHLEEYIVNLFSDKDTEVNPYVAIDDIVEYKDAYGDYEHDPSYEQKWYYEHDPNVFESNGGYIENNGEAIPEPMVSFDKTGAYYTKLRVRDNPVGEYDDLDEYRLWSDESVIQKIFVVHTRPVADFEVSLYENNEETCYANISENSYDPDHISSSDKGIKEKIYRWKNLKDTKWTEGVLPNKLPVGEEFFVSLVVKDTEGDLSKPCVKLVSTKEFKPLDIENDNTPPEIFIEPDKMNLKVGEKLLVYGYAIDDFGVDSFEMYINGEKVLDTTGRVFYTPNSEGTITITGKAVDLRNNSSEKTVTIRVSDDRDKIKPIINITSPLSGAVISGNVSIVGSITDNVDIYKYTATIQKANDDTSYLISEGDSEVVNKAIAELDTTGFENGSYVITITAADTSGNTGQVSLSISIENIVEEPEILSVRVVLEKDVMNIEEVNYSQ